MFTGLIEEVGIVFAIDCTERATQLQIAAPRLAKGIGIGESVAVNGCCLTVSARDDDRLVFDILEETLSCTNFKTLRRESPVNLERALAADGRLGGHFVQGHIDCAAQIISFKQTGSDHRLEVELNSGFSRYVIGKGSIAVNGISFTIAEVSSKSFAVWVIPHTKKQTNLASAKPGDLVNVEFDILAKYVERMLPPHAPARS
jgi:riboflavin synthase